MKLKLIQKKEETKDVISFIFQPSEPISWKAGQFFHYVLHHEPTDDRGSDRWFTISDAPFEGKVMITTRFTPDKGSTFKKALKNLKIGESIEATNLSGEFVIDDPKKEYVFIAGGIGITPFRSILKQLDYEGKPINVNLIYSNRDQNVVFKQELESIAKDNPNFQIHYIFSPSHIDEKVIRQLVPDLEKPIFYISGPEPMVDNIGNILKGMNIPKDHIQGDWFPGYSEI